MKQKLPAREEIETVFAGIPVFNILAETPTAIYSFEDDSLESVRDFAVKMDIKAVFVERTYIDRDSLKIGNELFKDLKMDIIGGVQFDSHRFNRDIDSVDLSTPVEMRVFVLHEGRAFGTMFVDEDMDSLRAISPEQRVEMFAEERRKRLKEQTIITAKKEDPMIEKFSEVLVLDRLYRNLRSDNDRFNYVIKIARRPGNDNLKKAVLKDDGTGFSNDKIRLVVALTLKKTDPNSDDTVQMVFSKD